MRIGYADPPYVGCAHLYRDHPDFAGEVDHAELIARLESDYDGWVLHAAATPASMATLAPLVAAVPDARWMSWVKGFATAALRAGLDPKTVAKLGGWKDVTTVMKFYAHAREDATLSDAVFGNSPMGAQLVKVK